MTTYHLNVYLGTHEPVSLWIDTSEQVAISALLEIMEELEQKEQLITKCQNVVLRLNAYLPLSPFKGYGYMKKKDAFRLAINTLKKSTHHDIFAKSASQSQPVGCRMTKLQFQQLPMGLKTQRADNSMGWCDTKPTKISQSEVPNECRCCAASAHRRGSKAVGSVHTSCLL